MNRRRAVAPPAWSVFRSRLFCVAAVCACALPLGLARRAGLEDGWIFLGSIFLFGLAHGACDLWVPGWVAGRRKSAGFLATFAGVYLALTLLVLLLWWWRPLWATVCFLLLTAWHWGSADAALTAVRSWRGGLLAWGRGFCVLTAPAAFHPAQTWQVLHALSPELASYVPLGPLPGWAGVLLSASLVAQILALAGGACRADQIGHGLETCFLLTMFVVLEPLVATALYFVWFHAWRHIGRLCGWQSPDTRVISVRLWRFHRAAVPCGVGALVLLWAVAQTWPGDLLRAYLVLLSAVTLPHALLVLWLDRRGSCRDSGEPISLAVNGGWTADGVLSRRR
ncbi:MAG: Brp/Blh family beta-carotene 15,15'-dioxygenase [Rhodospirillales bacterium]|nr:Brp/Blh family beta-carotene 15,15'-dioxygenase [Acetobacter sp.]